MNKNILHKRRYSKIEILGKHKKNYVPEILLRPIKSYIPIVNELNLTQHSFYDHIKKANLQRHNLINTQRVNDPSNCTLTLIVIV